MAKRDKPPPGGWLGPPDTSGLAPVAVLGRKGKWRRQELTRKEQKRHKRFQRAMKRADEKGEWRFEW